MSKILIVDLSPYKQSLNSILLSQGYEVIMSDSAFDAMTKLKAYDFDLVISEIELPGDNAFDLYGYLSNHYPYIPTIMTTDKNIDIFFDKIFEEGIGNVLCKPLKKEVLVKLVDKLITKKNIFGLNNYIIDIVETKKIRITNSKQIQKGIGLLVEEIEKWGFSIINKMLLTLVLNEMAINAVYHSHGLTKEKEARQAVQLEDGKHVDLFFAHSKNKYGISITDYNGILSRDRILKSINKVIEQDHIIIRAQETGEDISGQISETGRGNTWFEKLAGEYYFIIKKGVRTEIIMIFDTILSFDDDQENYSSLKIIEDYNSE